MNPKVGGDNAYTFSEKKTISALIASGLGIMAFAAVDMSRNIAAGTAAQGSGLVGFYISIMIAVILVLDVVWPTIDSKINGNSTSYNNLSATAQTLISLFGLILALGLLIMMLRPVM